MSLKKQYTQEYKDLCDSAFGLIFSAREATAGTDVKDFPIVVKLLKDASAYVEKATLTNIEFKNIWGNIIKAMLDTVANKLESAKDYGDRLGPDQLLCDLLNVLTEHAREW